MLARAVRRAEEQGNIKDRSSSEDVVLEDRSFSMDSVSTVATEKDFTQDEVVSMDSVSTVATEKDFTEDEVGVKAFGLAKAMKDGTKRVHFAAENTQFVMDLQKGVLPEFEYVNFLCQLYYVYETLEKCLERLPEHWKHFDLGELRRTPAIASDLQKFGALTALAQFHSPSTQQYVDHLEQLSRRNPLLLLSHAYTRYLGDLSGGQILAREIAAAYGLSVTGPGTAFYRFESLQTSLKQAKVEYRRSLDALDLSIEQKEALVYEAKVAFVLNVALMEERDIAGGHLPKARTLKELLELCDTKMSPLQMQAAYRGECPFLSKGGRGKNAKGHGNLSESKSKCPLTIFSRPWACLSSLVRVGGTILLLAFTGRIGGGSGCPFAKWT